MMTRLAELDYGDVFEIGGRDYIKLDHDDVDDVIAINKSPLTNINVIRDNPHTTIGMKAFSNIMSIEGIKYHEHSQMVDVSMFARYKHLLTPVINDNWYIEWTNKAQGENGDYCYIDPYGDYCIGRCSDGVGAPKDNILNIRQVYLFNKDTIVSVEKRC